MKIGDKVCYIIGVDVAVLGTVLAIENGMISLKRDSYVDRVPSDRVLEAVDGVLTFPVSKFLNINLQGLDTLQLKRLDLSHVISVTYTLTLTLNPGLKVDMPPSVKDYEVWSPMDAPVNVAPKQVQENIFVHGAADVALLALFQSGCAEVILSSLARTETVRNPRLSVFRNKLRLVPTHKKFAKLR